ncbi:MAG TPA: hypothetical protein VKA63_07275, partial [Candidatus Krumholzibacteria bacterium]|nr:hypothetical protein [Candidatus Krumholzibacteria bacterium]
MKFCCALLLAASLTPAASTAFAADCVDYTNLMRITHTTWMRGQILAVQGQELLLLNGRELHRLDVGNPDDPREEGIYALPAVPDDFVWTGDALLMATHGDSGGIATFQLGPPPQLQSRGFEALYSASTPVDLCITASGYIAAVAADTLHVYQLGAAYELQVRGTIVLPLDMIPQSVDGDRICLSNTRGGLYTLVNLEDPSHPRIEAQYTAWNGWGAVLKGNWLYTADDSVIRVISLANLEHPEAIASLSIADLGIHAYKPRLFWKNSTLFCAVARVAAADRGSLLAVDVSDARHPTRIGSLEVPDSIDGIVPEENRPYGYALTNSGAYLRSIDFSRPANIEYSITYSATDRITTLRSIDDGRRLILGLGTGELRVIDRKTDGSWNDTSLLSMYPYRIEDIVYDGRYVYAVGAWDELATYGSYSVYDLREYRNLENVGGSLVWAKSKHLARDGNQVAVSLFPQVAYCLDHGPSEEPHVVAKREPSYSTVFPVKGSWCSLNKDQLEVLGPIGSEPYVLETVSTVSLPFSDTTWMIRSKDILYVLAEGGIAVLDVSDPQIPSVMSTLANPYANGTGAAIAGDLLAVPCGLFGLSLFDLSDPLAPEWIGLAPAFHDADDLSLSSEGIFVADPRAGILQFPFPCGLAISVPAFQPFASLRVSSIDGGLHLSWQLTASLAWDSFEILRRDEFGPSSTVASISYTSTHSLGADVLLPVSQRAGYFSILGQAEGMEYESEEIRFDPPPLPSMLLQGAVPNPFNPSTEITYYQSSPSQAFLKIYDVRGRLVWAHEEFGDEGWHRVRWNGTDTHGRA